MSTYSSNLRIELIGTGDQAGNWGNTTNDNLSTVLEAAIAGRVSVTTAAAKTALTYVNGPTSTTSANASVRAILTLNTSTGADFEVYAPPVSKLYIIKNASSYTATIYNSNSIGSTTPAAGATGAAIPAGKTIAVWSDGTNFAVQTAYLQDTEIATPTVTGGTLTSPTLVTPKIQSSTALVVPIDSDFIIVDNNMVTGGYYEIVSPGSTDFTAFGAANNNAGTRFTCTLPASPTYGSGTVYDLTNGSLIYRTATDVLTSGTGSTTGVGRRTLVDTTTAQTQLSKTLIGATLSTQNSIQSLFEKATITASAPSATTNFDVLTQAVQYYTSNATTNFTLNIRGAASASATNANALTEGTYYSITAVNNSDFRRVGASANTVGTAFYATGTTTYDGSGSTTYGTATKITTLDELMSTGQSLTIALLVTNGTSTKSGTYGRSGTTVTVTITSHGLATGDSVYLDFSAGTGGTATDGTYTVTVTGTNTFTVTDSASGTITGSPSVTMTAPRYPNVFKIDGTTVTPKWQNGAAPKAGFTSSVNVYVYTIIKTGSAAYTVLASQTKFA